MSARARLEAGELLRRVQLGESLRMPTSRPMPSIGRRCHELRITDGPVDWRVVYRTDPDAVVVLEVFRKQSMTTPRPVVETCRERLRYYDAAANERESG